MTILMTRVLLSPAFDVSSDQLFAANLAVIAASNVGANFTLIGSLAAVMWKKLLNVRIPIQYKLYTMRLSVLALDRICRLTGPFTGLVGRLEEYRQNGGFLFCKVHMYGRTRQRSIIQGSGLQTYLFDECKTITLRQATLGGLSL